MQIARQKQLLDVKISGKRDTSKSKVQEQRKLDALKEDANLDYDDILKHITRNSHHIKQNYETLAPLLKSELHK